MNCFFAVQKINILKEMQGDYLSIVVYIHFRFIAPCTWRVVDGLGVFGGLPAGLAEGSLEPEKERQPAESHVTALGAGLGLHHGSGTRGCLPNCLLPL